MFLRTPLAWKNLTHDRRRLAVAISGVGFAVSLIFMELGFLNALLESTVRVLRRLNGDLVLLSTARYAFPVGERFELNRVYQAQGLPGVRSVAPFYVETSRSVLRQKHARGYPIRVLGFDPADRVVGLDFAPALLDALHRPAMALADSASRGKYGIPARSGELEDYHAELAGQPIRLVGQFRLGIDFANDGTLAMTSANFAHFFPNRAPGRDPLSLVDLAVVRLDESADPRTVQQALRDALPDDVDVLGKQELIDREMNFWRRSAPVGYIFLVGVYVGFIVGVVICYQIIYADVADHMPEFATLRAMGYTNGFFLKLILTQSLYLALFGFVPGALLSYASYDALSAVTGLTMQLTFPAIVSVLLVTIAMCLVSGILALRKLLSVDPAELF